MCELMTPTHAPGETKILLLLALFQYHVHTNNRHHGGGGPECGHCHHSGRILFLCDSHWRRILHTREIPPWIFDRFLPAAYSCWVHWGRGMYFATEYCT
jgi:hypothetical protein